MTAALSPERREMPIRPPEPPLCSWWVGIMDRCDWMQLAATEATRMQQSKVAGTINGTARSWEH